ncbi:4Fe-4S dicluster domain-containing protein [Nitratidesulfovibrio liaohensis]|uniref:4Fe-4S dicluster domain-containing protein n=1 Tax=Nitratidesulfovibrio liaohensis TaxID=2604158 RepID=A0ABY9R4R0_9BACT|nr:4Fe-4S dicluster domain-containing protein [Nitratidesulfovibrio liaohensis]WMW65788.1 4Fe-4S dicluster domain-containing protein [Nitratidesulfovibrio liaohensis]
MGHIAAGDIYRRLGHAIDNTPVRTPWNDAFHAMLRELYTPEEAELVVRMPYRPSSIGRLERVTGMNRARLQGLLDRLCDKGLVLDIREDGDHAANATNVTGATNVAGATETAERWAASAHGHAEQRGHDGHDAHADRAHPHAHAHDHSPSPHAHGRSAPGAPTSPHSPHHDDGCLYMISPIVIGIFEFTMMRTGGALPSKRWAELFHDYMFGDRAFLDANFGDGQRVSVMRALPHQQTLGDHVEILDYERATALVEQNRTFAVGLCSCRHEKHHLGTRQCDVDMETCTSMGTGAEYLIRHGFARRIDKAAMHDILARSRDLGFTLSADNVQQGVGFICHCCGCCCNLMQGIRQWGHAGILVTSSFIARCDASLCNGCGLCERACPIDAVSLPVPPGGRKRDRRCTVDEAYCLGCGACALKCPTGALRLHPRERKVLHPADSFERVILQSLERGTLQNLVFDNPNSRTQEFMRGLVGGFLRLGPIKRALMGEALRSRFLDAVRRMAG